MVFVSGDKKHSSFPIQRSRASEWGTFGAQESILWSTAEPTQTSSRDSPERFKPHYSLVFDSRQLCRWPTPVIAYRMLRVNPSISDRVSFCIGVSGRGRESEAI